MLPYGRKNPLPFPFSERSPVSGLRQAKKQRETGVKRVETAGVYPLAPPRVRRIPALRRAQLSAEVQQKRLPPGQGEPPARFKYPARSVQKRSRPSGANPPAAVRVPRSPCAEKRKAPQNCFHGAQSMHFYSNRSSVSTSLRAGACGSCAG